MPGRLTHRVRHVLLPEVQRRSSLNPIIASDLTPCGFHLFLKLEDRLRGRQFTSDEKRRGLYWQAWLRVLPANFFCDNLTKIGRRWQTCLDRDGHYVE